MTESKYIAGEEGGCPSGLWSQEVSVQKDLLPVPAASSSVRCAVAAGLVGTPDQAPDSFCCLQLPQ